MREKDIDFEMSQILAKDSKGEKDRLTMLPDTAMIYTHILKKAGKA